jgi:aspartyl-tRNA synthetase
VRLRESPNPKLPTGAVEVVPAQIRVLGRCRYNELPFEINRSRDADEAAGSNTAIWICATPG